MNENELSMDALRRAVAEELLTMKPEAHEEESGGALPPVSDAAEERDGGRVPFFRRAETLAQLVDELGELRETVEELRRSLQQQREDFEKERLRAEAAEDALRQENRALCEELRQLRETDALIHMRVFDNRVRISELKEELEREETEAQA